MSLQKRKQPGGGMVDTSAKEITKRVARAAATIKMGKKAFEILLKDGSPKGNVFETAKVAAMTAVKLTPQMIPFCHPLEINKVSVQFEIDKKKYQVTSVVEVACMGRTGVEMEALTGASAAALTIYDMMKWVSHSMTIFDVALLHKSGGKSGVYNKASW